MINEEVGVNRGNESAYIFRVKETATELSVFDIADRRCLYNGFGIVANKANRHRADTACRNSVAGNHRRVEAHTSERFCSRQARSRVGAY